MAVILFRAPSYTPSGEEVLEGVRVQEDFISDFINTGKKSVLSKMIENKKVLSGKCISKKRT